MSLKKYTFLVWMMQIRKQFSLYLSYINMIGNKKHAPCVLMQLKKVLGRPMQIVI